MKTNVKLLYLIGGLFFVIGAKEAYHHYHSVPMAIGYGVLEAIVFLLFRFLVFAFKSLKSFVIVQVAIVLAQFCLHSRHFRYLISDYTLVSRLEGIYFLCLFGWLLFFLYFLFREYREQEREGRNIGFVSSFPEFYEYAMYQMDREITPVGRNFLAKVDEKIFANWGTEHYPVRDMVCDFLRDGYFTQIANANILYRDMEWRLYYVIEEGIEFKEVKREAIERFFMEYEDFLEEMGLGRRFRRDELCELFERKRRSFGIAAGNKLGV